MLQTLAELLLGDTPPVPKKHSAAFNFVGQGALCAPRQTEPEKWPTFAEERRWLNQAPLGSPKKGLDDFSVRRWESEVRHLALLDPAESIRRSSRRKIKQDGLKSDLVSGHCVAERLQ